MFSRSKYLKLKNLKMRNYVQESMMKRKRILLCVLVLLIVFIPIPTRVCPELKLVIYNDDKIFQNGSGKFRAMTNFEYVEYSIASVDDGQYFFSHFYLW